MMQNKLPKKICRTCKKPDKKYYNKELDCTDCTIAKRLKKIKDRYSLFIG